MDAIILLIINSSVCVIHFPNTPLPLNMLSGMFVEYRLEYT